MTGSASVVKNAQDREHRRKFVFGFDSLRSRDKKKTEEGAPLLGMRGRGGPYIYKVRTVTHGNPTWVAVPNFIVVGQTVGYVEICLNN